MGQAVARGGSSRAKGGPDGGGKGGPGSRGATGGAVAVAKTAAVEVVAAAGGGLTTVLSFVTAPLSPCIISQQGPRLGTYLMRNTNRIQKKKKLAQPVAFQRLLSSRPRWRYHLTVLFRAISPTRCTD
jgi:hypothetical protein